MRINFFCIEVLIYVLSAGEMRRYLYSVSQSGETPCLAVNEPFSAFNLGSLFSCYHNAVHTEVGHIIFNFQIIFGDIFSKQVDNFKWRVMITMQPYFEFASKLKGIRHLKES